MNYTLLNKNTEMYTDIRRVFVNRGVQPSEIEHYLNVSSDDENSPELLDNIKQGAQLFMTAAKHRDNVALVVDCDCDGFTASALLYNYWWRLLPNWVENNWQWFIHENKEHGLSDVIETVLTLYFLITMTPNLILIILALLSIISTVITPIALSPVLVLCISFVNILTIFWGTALVTKAWNISWIL